MNGAEGLNRLSRLTNKQTSVLCQGEGSSVYIGVCERIVTYTDRPHLFPASRDGVYCLLHLIVHL